MDRVNYNTLCIPRPFSIFLIRFTILTYFFVLQETRGKIEEIAMLERSKNESPKGQIHNHY